MNQVNKSFFSLKSKIGGNQNYLKKKKKEERIKNQEDFYFLTE